MHADPARLKRAIGWLAAFALPLVTVQLAEWALGGGGPARAHAGHSADSSLSAEYKALLSPAPAPVVEPFRMSMVERLNALRSEPFGPTPMLHGTPERPPAPIVVSAGDADTLTQLHLQAVVSGSGTHAARALINGRVHAVGDAAHGTNWIITEIDAESRRVLLTHPRSGRTIELTLRMPR